ncbi:iron-containing alcohol dehydrogenase family protein [Halorarum salinum]|uniref:Iron-containing alcohol dehydrogenase n=1 Tax=Halorarum salinum TaxID=2743089 RepID=A0A7D5QC01_9EURY|nr:iron-containing alcohol dehydrogenase family protein [Halobaculum salinum]QLG62260.1 iron-containing alcohol dehydrogenase [Halobaculum salinum]
MNVDPFVFEFRPGTIRYGRGRVADLGEALADEELDRALVVCGRNVGANRDLMDRVEAGLGDRLADVFDGTTPDKRAETAVEVAGLADGLDADALVPVGGGSSLDVAKVASALRADGRGIEDVRAEVRESGGISMPADGAAPTPLVPVPTTLAGADMSVVAGITVEVDGEEVSTGVGGDALMPAAFCYDPALFETTPDAVLAGSAMNGFDKAVESLYARHRSAITDATATRAVRYLLEGLPRMTESADAMDAAVAGVVLAQYGVSRPGSMTLNVLHAFGHGLRDAFAMQQGVAHAVVAPHALADLFDSSADTDALVEAFGADDGDEVVDRVADLRDALGLPDRLGDALGLPGRLRDVEGATCDGVEEAAEATAADPLLGNAPAGYELGVEDARRILEAAW